MEKIFISYARSDYDKALELNNYLGDQGFSPWLDKKDLLPGQEWKVEIKRAIKESTVFIACLSNDSVSKQGFVQVELKEGLDVAEEMPQGRIYIIPVRLDECDVPSRLERYQWMDYFEPGEQEKLIRAIQLRVKPLEKSKSEREKYFDAGERVTTVCNELGISTSQFIELLDLSSQREYEAMESRKKEFPLSLLKKVTEVSGVNLEWLKHEKRHRYIVEAIYLNPIEDDLAYCASLKPQEYFLTLDKKQLHVGLVVQISKYRYQVLEMGVTLDFWNWIDAHWAIPAFYNFLKNLSDPWHDITGVFLSTKYGKQLFDGEIHFLTALRNAEDYGGDLLYDLLDIDHHRLDLFPYSKTYGGNWMDRVHDVFRELRDNGKLLI